MASTPHTAGDPGKNSSKIKFNPLDPELKLPVPAGLCFLRVGSLGEQDDTGPSFSGIL